MLERDFADFVEMIGERRFGKYRGTVVDNVDPEHRGKLQVKVPALLGDQAIWALPCVPVANGDGSGFFAVPNKDACVWVEFEAGNIHFPIWSGCFWPSNAIPSADGAPAVKFWKTRSFTIRLDDDAGEMTIEANGGGKLKISATEVAAEASSVSQAAGAKKVELTAGSFDVANGAFTVV
jgi:hypothetical protein